MEEATLPLRGAKIVVTGVTGQVAEPVAVRPGQARTGWWGRPGSRTMPPVGGSRRRGCAAFPSTWSGDVGGLPADADYVINFAVSKTNNWDRDLQANSGGAGLADGAPSRARPGSSTARPPAVYKPLGHHVFAEEDELGDNHGVWPFLRTYSISKIAAEATARWAAVRFDLPTTMARLSVPYGDRGGWPAIHLEMMLNRVDIPVHVDAPSVYHPLHEDDIIAMIPGCWPRRPHRPPPSTGVATRRSASRSGAAICPS